MKIRFQTLQDNLRAAIWARLERGDVTGSALASRAGFQQAHLSNFLNSRRGLSLQAMDRLLDVLHLDILDLAGVNEASRHGPGSGQRSEAQLLAVVRLITAATFPRFGADQIQDTWEMPKSFLRRLKPRMTGNRRDWTRFVMVKVEEEEATGMSPLVKAGALLLLDRHHNAPPPVSDDGSLSLYAVRHGPRCLIRRITLGPGSLMLRPISQDFPLQAIPVAAGQRPADFVIGRVRYLSREL